jgi:hypothetical protein
MAASIRPSVSRWIFDHLLWDTAGPERKGLLGGLWAARKLLLALTGAALLTWQEWVKHHPPEIAIVAVIHFVFVSGAIALTVWTWHWLRRTDTKSQASRGKRSRD